MGHPWGIRDKGLGTIAWICNLAPQTIVTSRNRDEPSEPGSGSPSHEPSYKSGFMGPSAFPYITESLFSTRIVIDRSNGNRVLGDRDR